METTLLKKGYISFLLAICLTFSMVTLASANTPSDVSDNWAKDTILEWVNKAYVEGYTDGSFKPDTNITRAEVATLINRSFGFEQGGDISFSDVNLGDWYYNAVAVASATGYISGYTDGTFKPTANINRQELAVIISRLLDLESSDSYMNFEDSINSPEWSRGAIGAVIDAEVLGGYPDGTFQPSKSATRAEVVVILDRALMLFSEKLTVNYNKAGTYGPELGNLIIDGNVVVNVSGVALQNITITGDLLLAEGIGEGDAFLNNVTVEGNTTIEGGGANSIHLENSVLVTITVNKKDNTIRIVVTGSSTVKEVILQSSAKLEESDDSTGAGFGNVTLSDVLPEGSNVELVGSFETVDIQAASINISIPKGSVEQLNVSENAENTNIDINAEAKIVDLVLDAIAKVVGQGVIDTATINVSGSSIENEPTNTEVKEGVTVDVGGEEVTTPSPSSGGGGGGGSSTPEESNNATVTSSVYDVDTNAIAVPNGTTLVDFKAGITPADGASFEVYETDGITAATDLATGYKVIVTAENGTTTKTYTITVVPDVVLVSAITVTGTGDAGTIPIDNGTLQMLVTVTPEGATNRAVIWSITNGTGSATISAGGLLKAIANGTVTVKATAKDGSGKFGEIEITISGQTPTVDKVALTDAISAANTNKTTVTVSTDGADVLPVDKWVTAGIMTSYTDTITAAQAISDKLDATQTEVDDAITALITSTNIFNNAKLDGTKLVTEASVASLTELKAALNDTSIETIHISANIVDITETLVVDRALTINGGDKTLHFTDALNGLANGERQGILIGASGVKINNLTVQMAGASGWQGVYGIQVYNATGVELNNFTGTGADAALLVNGSAVELIGVTTVSGNEFGGIEVSKGTAAGLSNSTLTVTGTLVNGTEAYGKPTIWLVNGQGSLSGINVPTATNLTIKTDQTQYYIIPANAADPA